MMGSITGSGLTGVVVGENHPIQEYIRSVGAFEESSAADWSRPFADQQTLESVGEKYAASVPYGFAPFSDNIVDELVAHARLWKPDLVVWDSLCYAGVVAAAAVGAAHFRVLWTVDIYGAMYRAFATLRAEAGSPVTDVFADWLGAHLESVGSQFDEHSVTGQVTVDQIPASVQVDVPITRQSVRYVDFNGPSQIPDWVRRPAERPRVVLTGGVSFELSSTSGFVSLSKLIGCFADSDVELVIAGARGLEQSSVLPKNVRVVDFVPMHAVLPGAAAVIHHGGFGTWATAALRGVPQLVLPIRHGDLWIRAERTADLGAARMFHPTSITESDIVTQAQELIDDASVRLAADGLAAEIACTESPNDVVRTWESLVAQYR